MPVIWNRETNETFTLNGVYKPPFLFQLQDSGSSGEKQGTISLSVDDPNITPINLQASLSLPPKSPRTLGRAQSAGGGDATPTDLSLDVKSPASDVETRSTGSNKSSKRNRFLLKRQDCLEQRGCEGEVDLTITPTTVRSSPNSPLMIGGVSSQNLGSPPPAHDHTLQSDPVPLPLHPPPPSTGPSFSIDSATEQFLCESLASGGAPAAPSNTRPPPLAHSHKLPSVRVIQEAVDPLSLEESTGNLNYGLLHPNFRSSLDYTHHPQPIHQQRSRSNHPPPPPPPLLHEQYSTFGNLVQPPGVHPQAIPPTVTTAASTIYGSTATIPPSVSSAISSAPAPLPPPPPPTSSVPNTTSSILSGIGGTSAPTEQFGHCPKEREGPALGCNYCWNTTDLNGRILRRKTKYQCPDCQANLCIVPCFQAYHEALEKEKNNSDHKSWFDKCLWWPEKDMLGLLWDELFAFWPFFDRLELSKIKRLDQIFEKINVSQIVSMWQNHFDQANFIACKSQLFNRTFQSVVLNNDLWDS